MQGLRSGARCCLLDRKSASSWGGRRPRAVDECRHYVATVSKDGAATDLGFTQIGS